MKNEFSVINGENLSINNLLKFKKDGGLVFRSGHSGNHYLSNLILFAAGVPCHIFDRNLLLRDTNYYPGYVFIDSQKIKISQSGNVLVPFAVIDKGKESNFTDISNGFANLGNLHYESMVSLFGQEDVWSESELMYKNAGIIGELIYWISKFDPNLFIRRVDNDGKTYRDGNYSGNVVEEVLGFNEKNFLKIKGIESSFSGGIIPNVEAAIMLIALIGVLTTGYNKVIEVSGPDMINYAFGKVFTENMNNLYSFLKNKIPGLPETVELIVVPSFYFRLGSLSCERAEMDLLWDNLKKIPLLKKEKGVLLSEVSANEGRSFDKAAAYHFRSEIIRNFDNKRSGVLRDIVSSNKIVERMNFSSINESGTVILHDRFFSQYDLISCGEKLYIPEEILSISMKKAAEFYAVIKSAQKQF